MFFWLLMRGVIRRGAERVTIRRESRFILGRSGFVSRELISILLFVAVYIVLTRVALPKLGVPT